MAVVVVAAAAAAAAAVVVAAAAVGYHGFLRVASEAKKWKKNKKENLLAFENDYLFRFFRSCFHFLVS